MKKISLIFLLIFFAIIAKTQPSTPKEKTDSLWAVWQDKTESDTNRLKAINNYIKDRYLFTNPDSAYYFAKKQFDFAKQKNLKKYMAEAMNTQGISFDIKGNYIKAIDYYEQSLEINEKIGNEHGVATTLNSMGIAYKKNKEYNKAIDYYMKSLEIMEKIKDKHGIVKSLNNLGNLYSNQGDYDNAIKYYKKSLKVIEEIGDKKIKAFILDNISGFFYEKSNYTKAFYYLSKTYEIQKELDNKEGIVNVLNRMAAIYKDQGNYSKALNYYYKALKINEELKNKHSLAITLNDIGIIYKDQGDYSKAMEYYLKSLKLREEINDLNGIGRSLNNIANIYSIQEDYSKAIEYYFKCLKIMEESGDKFGVSTSLRNIGNSYRNKGEYSKALDYISRNLEISKEIKYQLGIASSFEICGLVYLDQYNYKKSLNYSMKAHNIYNEIGFLKGVNNTSESLWKAYKKLGNSSKALEMYELYIATRDSIESEKIQKEVIRQEFKYNYEKKAAIDSIANAKEKEIKDAKIAQQQTEIKAKRNQQYALFGGLFLVIVFAGVMYNRFRVTRKQKVIIEEKERETHAQKEIIEEKHKEITDSINYAERIQRSFLATKEILDENLKEYFVLFRPKDVVSGDFYWAAKLNNGKFAFACADSTGHGVPGAIMSILNISSLEKSIETQTEPHKILHETRKIIINRLKKDGSAEGGKDGMDCSLLVLNQEKNQLTFASANNSVFIIRNGKILEFKGDKMPVGKHDNADEIFTLHNVDLQKGDVIYSLTDGFPDQFGGNKGKKYMIKNLKNLLLEITLLPLKEQEEKLANEFDNWKGSEEQVDDVCIIGVRV